MFGDFHNIIIQVFDSLSKWFADLSCKAYEVLDETDEATNTRHAFQRAVFLVLGAISITLYGLVGVIRAIFHAIISLFFGNRHINGRLSWSYIKSGLANVCSAGRKEVKDSARDILSVFLVCVALFVTIFCMSSSDFAKKANLYYFNNRTNINKTCQYDLPPVNTSDMKDNPIVYHIRKSMECTKTSPRVARIREAVNDNLPTGAHFATVNDYLLTLLALEQYDILDLITLLDADSIDKANEDAALFHQCLEKSCIIFFSAGQFYKSNTCLELVMKFSDFGSISFWPKYNNSFYLMRLFNENIIDRYLSSHYNNDVLESIIEDIENVKSQYWLDNIGSSHEDNLGTYLRGLCYFHEAIRYKLNPPTEYFRELYSSTSSNMIKQYSLYMALRSQCIYVTTILDSDNAHYVNECISEWRQIEDLCRKEITYPYLLNTYKYHTVDFVLSN